MPLGVLGAVLAKEENIVLFAWSEPATSARFAIREGALMLGKRGIDERLEWYLESFGWMRMLCEKFGTCDDC